VNSTIDPVGVPAVHAALFDVDGTLIETGQVWTVLLRSPDVRRFKKHWLHATALPHYVLSKTGLVSQSGFRNRWVRLMAWLMAGWTDDQARALYEQTVLSSMISALRSDVWDILKQHKAAGHPVILVSTMFEGIVNRFAEHVGADIGLGSIVGFRDGYCTGQIIGETCSGERKVAFARRYLEQQHPDLALAACAAYADSRSDIPFLSGVGFPVATYPDDAMRAAASECGWMIYEKVPPQ
jgi:putative phosphoserine phosphatase/1-acylglycerol-3-phosphate O-acyltransferase